MRNLPSRVSTTAVSLMLFGAAIAAAQEVDTQPVPVANETTPPTVVDLNPIPVAIQAVEAADLPPTLPADFVPPRVRIQPVDPFAFDGSRPPVRLDDLVGTWCALEERVGIDGRVTPTMAFVTYRLDGTYTAYAADRKEVGFFALRRQGQMVRHAAERAALFVDGQHDDRFVMLDGDRLRLVSPAFPKATDYRRATDLDVAVSALDDGDSLEYRWEWFDRNSGRSLGEQPFVVPEIPTLGGR